MKNTAARGGVLKDDQGYWLRGFFRNLGKCSVLKAEHFGILEALRLAWSMRIDSLYIESDSLVGITLVQEPIQPTHRYASIIREVKEMLQR